MASAEDKGRHLKLALQSFRQNLKEQGVTVKEAKTTSRKPAAKPRQNAKSGAKPGAAQSNIDKAKPKIESMKNSLTGKPSAKSAPGGARGAQATDKVPVAVLIKKVLQHLESVRKGQDAKDIMTAVGIDVMADQELFDALKDNSKITYSAVEATFTYKAKFSLRDKNGLINFVRKFPDGTHVTDLKDAYKGVLEDLQALKNDRHVYILWSADTQEDVVFPVDDTYREYVVDEGVVAAYMEVEVPTDTEELEEELRKAGIKPTERRVKRRRVEKVKEKKKREFRARKITNTHMMHLFEKAQPRQID